MAYRGAKNNELLRLLPRVLRARDFYLYLEGGKRITDLWLHGGRAILGHKSRGVLGELKNSAERGLFSPFPHHLENRLYKALALFFPGKAFRLYLDEGSLGLVLEAVLEKRGLSGSKTVSVWRPFMEGQEAPVMIPVLPWSLGPAALVLDRDLDPLFPPGDIIPPVLLAPAVRALYNLKARMDKPGGPCPRYARVEKALKNSQWRRNRIYLTSPLDTDSYAGLYRRFLDGGFLIPPCREDPAILPALMSPGEEAKLAELLEI